MGRCRPHRLAPLPGDGERVDLTPYPRAIAVAVVFPRAVIQDLLRGPSHTYLYYYNIINARLDDIALRLSNLLQANGLPPTRSPPPSATAATVCRAFSRTGWRPTWPAWAGSARTAA